MTGDPVFVTGGTGYVGLALIGELLASGRAVHALVRPASAGKLPGAALPVVGDALDASTYAAAIPSGATLVHLVGTPHPNPAKANEFRRVDLASVRAATAAAHQARVRHFIYVSVAHPAPVMHAYIAARVEGEALVKASGIPATVLRPWYVLGPGHRWPYVLIPIYAVLEWFAATRASVERLGLVTLEEMAAALMHAVERPPERSMRVIEVPEIRAAHRYFVDKRTRTS